MRRRLLSYWLCLLILKNATATVEREFGTDVKGSSVVAHKSGEITILDKNTYIKLPVPPCMEVKYVRVKIYQELTTPKVTFDKDTHTIHISYTQFQVSISRYEVVAKGIQNSQCGEGKEIKNAKGKGKGYGDRNRLHSKHHVDNGSYPTSGGEFGKYTPHGGGNGHDQTYCVCYCPINDGEDGQYTDFISSPGTVQLKLKIAGGNGQHEITYQKEDKEESDDEDDVYKGPEITRRFRFD